MKQVMCIIAIAFVSISLNAQEKTDSIAKKSEEQVTLSLKNLVKLTTERDQAVAFSDSLKLLYAKLNLSNKKTEEELNNRNDKILEYESNIKNLKNHISKSDLCLVNIASNFLYIPYEAYSIEKIAIPAFNNIFDERLKQKQQIKCNLLESYQNDIKSLMQFLKETQEDLNKPFTKHDVAVQKEKEFKEKDFYIRYVNYSDYVKTFLGAKFKEITSRLNKFDGQANKVDFGDILTKLNDCLNTVKDL